MKRWTIKELETKADITIIREILQERIQGLNEYAPLSRRVKEIDARLANLEEIHEGAKTVLSKADEALQVIRKEVSGWLNKKP